mgnify:CR=1 FL=1
MVNLAVDDNAKLRASDIEFKLPQPSYTVNTLAHLREKYPTHHFSLIMGEDNLKSFHKWKNFEVILERHDLYIYPRISEGIIETQFSNHQQITKVAAPIVEISSSFIRKSIQDEKSIRPLLPQNVWQYIDEMNFYK